eukprot:15333217-Ditylum_brightwellii.AAC.1
MSENIKLVITYNSIGGMKSKLDNDEDDPLEQLLAELNCILNSRKSNKSINTRKKLYAIARGQTIGISTNGRVQEVLR